MVIEKVLRKEIDQLLTINFSKFFKVIYMTDYRLILTFFLIGLFTSLIASILVCISFTSRAFGIIDGIILVACIGLFIFTYFKDRETNLLIVSGVFSLFNIIGSICLFCVSPDWHLEQGYFARFIVNEFSLVGFYVSISFLWPLIIQKFTPQVKETTNLPTWKEYSIYASFNAIIAILNGLFISGSAKDDDTSGNMASRGILISMICWALEAGGSIFLLHQQSRKF